MKSVPVMGRERPDAGVMRCSGFPVLAAQSRRHSRMDEGTDIPTVARHFANDTGTDICGVEGRVP